MSKLCNKLSEIIAGKFLGEFHMVLDDPTGNSYLQVRVTCIHLEFFSVLQ